MKMLPTLTYDGWIKDPKEILARLLQYFAASEGNQSSCYPVECLNELVIKYGTNPMQLAIELDRMLTSHLKRWYDDAHVTTSITTKNGSSEAHNLTTSIVVLSGDKKVFFKKEYMLKDKQLVES